MYSPKGIVDTLGAFDPMELIMKTRRNGKKHP